MSDPQPKAASPSSTVSKEHRALLNAALAGLLSATAVACGSESEGPPPGSITSDVVDPNVTQASFTEACDKRGGYVQVQPHCGGYNLCRGMSYDSGTHHLTEHTCKGLNTCAGYSCIQLPEDSGKSAEQVYEAECAGCHGDASDGTFVLPKVQGLDSQTAEANVSAHAAALQEELVALGGVAALASSTSSSHPAEYEKLSRSEVEQVVAFVRSLEPKSAQ